MLFCDLCFKDREAEADRTDKAEAGPAARASPAGKDAGMPFVPALPVSASPLTCLFPTLGAFEGMSGTTVGQPPTGEPTAIHGLSLSWFRLSPSSGPHSPHLPCG